jgi:hypothetical protein
VEPFLDRPQATVRLSGRAVAALSSSVTTAGGEQRTDRAHAEAEGHRAPDEVAAGYPSALQPGKQPFEFLACAHVGSS